MNTPRISVLRLAAVAACAVAIWLLPVTVAHATKFWKNSVATGSWNTGNNWSASSAAGADNAGVPSGEDVNIVNSDGATRTVSYDANSPSVLLVTINQTGGTATNTLSIANNSSLSLTAQAMFVGGWTGGAFGSPTGGRGAVIQNNGTVSMVSGSDLVVGFGASSTGTYTLNNGFLNAPQSEFIGSIGTGTMNQTGGKNTIGPGAIGYLNLGTSSTGVGNYNLSGTGQLESNKSEIIGDAGTGIFTQTGGTHKILVAGSDLTLGNAGTSHGTYTISGGTLDVNDDVFVGASGVGTLNVQTGGTVTVGDAVNINGLSAVNLSGGTLRLNSSNAPNRIFFGSGKLQLAGSRTIGTDPIVSAQFGAIPIIPTGKELAVEGDATVATPLTINGGKLSTPNYVIMGSSGSPTTVSVTNGGVLSPRYMWPIQYGSTLNMTGPGSSFTNDPNSHFSIGFNDSDGFMNITAGASVTTGVTGYVGNSSVGGGTGKGTVLVSGAGSTWTMGWALSVGSQAPGLLTIQDQALVSTGPAGTAVYDLGTLNLNGGTLRTTDIQVFDSGKFNFNSGTIILAYDRTVGSDPTIATYFGASPVLQAGKGLGIEGIATLVTPVVIDGGTLSVGQLATPANLGMNHGTLNITGQFVTVGTGGTLGNTLDLNSGMTVNVTVGTTNQGLITGDGELGGTLTNAAAGELRGEPGKSLKLTGANNTNAGQINLFGGMVEFTQNLTNNSGAFISGNGTIKTSALTNSGTMNFSGLANVVGDVTNSATGKIISSGGGPTTFFDDVVNNGEVRTSAGSFTTFYGSTSGSGTYTGLGTVNFEGDLKPGNSPAAVNFGGDVVLGVGSTLQIEIGGTVAGSQYDRLNVTGKLTEGGTLQVVLINGFVPSVGQTFDLLNWGTVTGSFTSVLLPALASGSWDVSQLSAGIVSVIGGIPGDYNQNGIVDAADYTVWRDHLNQSISLPNDQTPGVTQSDYDVWRTHFGQTAGSGSSATTNFAVPEPATFTLLLLAASVHQRRRRRAT